MPDPDLHSDGVILKVEANGVCRSDWHLWMGDWTWAGLSMELPHVMGHEFTGVIQDVGSEVTRFSVGDRVVVPFGQGDGTCDMCTSGHSNVCDHLMQAGVDFWGGYGEYAYVPRADTNLVTIPDDADFVEVASLGCRFMTAFHGVVDQANVKPGEWVVVHGCGGVGLSAIHIAKAVGANVIAVDINDDSLKLAIDLGAVATINGLRDDVVTAVHELTSGGAHVSVDALGIAATCQQSIGSLRKRGRHLQIGLTTSEEQGMVALPIDVMVQKEISFLGSLGMQASRFPDLLRMVESGVLQPGRLVTRTVSVDEAGQVIASMSEYKTTGVAVLNKW
jgi:D-arabinose 1-dehydrogenase-like Zn-dependent alcohol dehydrogenase